MPCYDSGWTVVTDQLAWITNPNPWGLTAQDGNNFLDLTAYPAGAPFGGIEQVLATTIGNEHQVDYFLGTYTARWGGLPAISIQASAGGTSQTCTVSTPSAASTWTACTTNFVAASTSTALRFVGTAGFQYIGLDNVSVNDLGASTTTTTTGQPVPEPGVLSLLGLVGVVIGTRRYRHSR